jgi:hypothetical protein
VGGPYGDTPVSGVHEMTAQIIPVLLVAVAVEQSARWGHRHSRWTRPVIVTLLVGEVTALLAVAFGKTESGVFLVQRSESKTDVLSSLIATALAIGFLGVVVIALLRGSDTAPYRSRGSSSGG